MAKRKRPCAQSWERPTGLLKVTLRSQVWADFLLLLNSPSAKPVPWACLPSCIYWTKIHLCARSWARPWRWDRRRHPLCLQGQNCLPSQGNGKMLRNDPTSVSRSVKGKQTTMACLKKSRRASCRRWAWAECWQRGWHFSGKQIWFVAERKAWDHEGPSPQGLWGGWRHPRLRLEPVDEYWCGSWSPEKKKKKCWQPRLRKIGSRAAPWTPIRSTLALPLGTLLLTKLSTQ